MSAHLGTLVVVGGGNMGGALVGGLIAGGWEPARITVVDLDETKRAELAARHGVATATQPVPADGAVVAVKPGDAAAMCTRLGQIGVPRILSIAAGLSAATLQDAAGGGSRVVRAMPNTPALVREGVSAMCGSASCDDDDLDWAESVLSAVGQVVRIPESQMDAFTAVAGSGPAYVFLLAEALMAAGVAEGLPPATADAIVRGLLRGAGILLAESADSAAVLRERVTSPNGTTAAGLAVFEERGLRAIVHEVVRAAAARSAEMGR
jgi:pyrroline-5-carboxylate reductase